MIRLHVFFEGNVQGVFFRANTRDKARELGVNGWVKNLPDGRVESVMEGSEDKVKQLFDYCANNVGNVTNFDVTQEEPEGLTDFNIKRGQ